MSNEPTGGMVSGMYNWIDKGVLYSVRGIMNLGGRRLTSSRERRVLEDRNGSNCMGTGLYLAGLIDEDRPAYSEEAKEHIGELSLLEKPESPCLISFWTGRDGLKVEDSKISHMGIVVGVYPLRAVHRDGIAGPLIINDPLKEKIKEHPGKIEYHTLDDRFRRDELRQY